MKKGKQIIVGIVFCVMIFSLAMTSIDVFAAYSSDWKSWTQSGSSNSNVKEYGCRVVAFAKIIYESGWADFSNPDEYFNIGVQNGWFQSGVTENGTFGNALSSYISSRGGTCNLIREISLNQNATSYTDDIMNYVRSGYYITLSCTAHTAYISPSASVAAGKPVVYDSGKSTSTSLIHDLSNKANTGNYWTKLRVWQIPAGGASGSSDTMMPCIQNVEVVEQTSNGYTIECAVTDNVGVAKVQFPTWESAKTSAGCTWYDGTYLGNNKWRFTFTDAINEAEYTTHIYAWDSAGNRAWDSGVIRWVDKTKPVFESISVKEKTSVGYKVTCVVCDNVGVKEVLFPTWETLKGSANCPWYPGTYVGNNTWEFEFKEGKTGVTFTTHVYAKDEAGNESSTGFSPMKIEEQVLVDPDDPTDPTTPETPTTPSEPTTPTTPSVPSTPGSTEDTTDQNTPNDVVVDDQDNDNIDAPPAVGTVVTYLGLNYKVIKNGKGCYMQCIGPVDKNVTKATVKSYISVGKYKYPVCQIKSDAFKNCKKLKKIVIGKNMKTIGKNVFYGCKKLESITIQSKKLAVVKSKAFKGVHNKVKIKVPKSKMEKYKKLLKKAGVKSTATFK